MRWLATLRHLSCLTWLSTQTLICCSTCSQVFLNIFKLMVLFNWCINRLAAASISFSSRRSRTYLWCDLKILISEWNTSTLNEYSSFPRSSSHIFWSIFFSAILSDHGSEKIWQRTIRREGDLKRRIIKAKEKSMYHSMVHNTINKPFLYWATNLKSKELLLN